MVHYLCYISYEAFPFDEDMLTELHEQVRFLNKENGITGLLLYKEGNFVQYIEGSKPAVQHLFQKIKEDVRHKHVIKIAEGDLYERQFDAWDMAFENVTPNFDIHKRQKALNEERLFKGLDPKVRNPGISVLKSFIKKHEHRGLSFEAS